jgi:hypothetical protein
VKNWWYRAEEAAGLDHVKGQGWHSLRRKFATELKGIPLKDLCKLGGWESPDTILTSYQSADEATMREALTARRTLRAPSVTESQSTVQTDSTRRNGPKRKAARG